MEKYHLSCYFGFVSGGRTTRIKFAFWWHVFWTLKIKGGTRWKFFIECPKSSALSHRVPCFPLARHGWENNLACGAVPVKALFGEQIRTLQVSTWPNKSVRHFRCPLPGTRSPINAGSRLSVSLFNFCAVLPEWQMSICRFGHMTFQMAILIKKSLKIHWRAAEFCDYQLPGQYWNNLSSSESSFSNNSKPEVNRCNCNFEGNRIMNCINISNGTITLLNL